jgi:hypothetical protein
MSKAVQVALMAEVARRLPDDAEVRDGQLGRLMSLLAFIYQADDVFRAYAGMTSSGKDVASNAVELLDNLPQSDHKRSLLPFIEACVL